MKFKIKGARLAVLLMPALALAAPAFAQVRSPLLADTTEPGSVIVFPKVLPGTVTLQEGLVAPKTEIEIGIVCPKGVTCSEHQAVKIRLHWVCGTNQANLAGSFICKETDFDVTATVFEKIVLTPNGETVGQYISAGNGGPLPTKTVPAANCSGILGNPSGGGYLIGWVIRASDDTPIKFDGLIGDAVIRTNGTAQGSYNAIPIQADPALTNLASVTTNGNGALFFDGAAGHYQAVTGQVLGDIRYDGQSGAGGTTATVSSITLLTLDVKSNRPNNPVFVDLDFFGGFASAIGNENQISTSTEFICWEEVAISAIDNGSNLTIPLMGRKGVFVSTPAAKVQIFGITDGSGPVSLLGLAEAEEGPNNGAPLTRVSFSNLFNSSVPVNSRFLPTPSPNFLP